MSKKQKIDDINLIKIWDDYLVEKTDGPVCHPYN